MIFHRFETGFIMLFSHPYCGYIENVSKINISGSFEVKRNYWDYNVYCGSKEEWVGLFEKYGNKNNMIEYVNTLFKEIGWEYND